MGMHLSRRAVIPALVVGVPAVAAGAWMLRDTAGFAKAGAALRLPLDLMAQGPTRMAELVRFATLAPNNHNTQAWRFSGDDSQITIAPDPARFTPVVDPDRHHSFVSLGAAAETLGIAASAYGLTARPVFDPAGERLRISLAPGGLADPLVTAVAQRQSNRSIYDGAPLTAPEQDALKQVTAGSEVVLHLVEDATAKTALRDLVVAANADQMDDPAFVAELRDWLRFSEAAALARADGLFSGCSGNPSMPQRLGGVVFPLVYRKASEAAKYSAQIDSSAALVLLVSAGDAPQHWVETGRVLARLTLVATDLGLAHAHFNQAVEVPERRAAVAALMGLTSGRASILLRLGLATPMPFALRRPVAQTLT
ncbi:Acg family FMN-binding oxidoreductase [Yoonia vestfoldensis]|uniref:Acg family FMN-binding oxidoreductase n=1 Tax=Yoonia vestfoldensis TaxID=245188 RepID=UPI0003775D1F|nr:hypothetical protein [Yoonia vestfoldensis]